eukprot:symbB.v1.2.015031.t1/scaffold1037.1/size142759/3
MMGYLRLIIRFNAWLVCWTPSQILAVEAKATVDFLWPIHLSKIPLSTQTVGSLEPPTFGEELAKVALEGFEEYVNKTLPLELELDKHFADEFHGADHSRVNLAFRRWQKRVYAEQNRDIYPVDGVDSGADILQRGPHPDFIAGVTKGAAPLKDVNYTWPALYENSAFRKLQADMLDRSGHTPDDLPKTFRMFIWAEVFRKGDSLRPSAHTDGGYVMGRYWPQLKKNAMKFNFEDPRGINPPFGKTHSHSVEEGALTMFPTWASHFITPNMKSKPAVSYVFIVYPEVGNTLDFEDDLTGNALETITVQLAGLEITLTARRVGSGTSSVSGSSFTFVGQTGSSASGASRVHSATLVEADPRLDQVLVATSAQDCARLIEIFPELDSWVSKLSASDPDWTPAARIGRAYRAGVLARLRLADQGGFMVVVPGEEDLESYIDELDRHGSKERPAFRTGNAPLETSRGRVLGEGPVLLVDFPWSMLEHFTSLAVLKAASMVDVDMAQWSVEGTAARPSKIAVRELADGWITSGMGGSEDTATEVAALRARLAELESQLPSAPKVFQATPKVVPQRPAQQGPGRVAGLFAQAPESGLSAVEFDKLQKLAGGGDSGSGGSSGIKGCLAREAFLKVMAENHKVAEVVRVTALRELGMDPSREDGSLMHRYIERRIPLAEHRLLAHFATLLGEAWATGHASGNTELLGVIGHMMIFTEQVAIDSGKIQVGWLLTGVAEPPFHLLTSRQKHPGLQQFSRLIAPGWVTANLAFLRDLDFLESRVAASNKTNPGNKKEADKEKDDKIPKGAGKAKKKKNQGHDDEAQE